MKKLILAFALQEEVVPAAFEGWEIITVVTGVSKPYASARLAHAIVAHKPDLVINVGSAGAGKHAEPRAHVGDIFVCDRFVDRDLEHQQFTSVSPQLCTTSPFTQGFSSRLAACGGLVERTFTTNTGDDFVTEHAAYTGQVVDMEAFAEALLCQTFGVPFFAVKYVTDIIGENSMQIWEERLAAARAALTDYLRGCTLKG
ncbi:MAG: nucleosidase [Prevotella sp.]|nr:nucleosidase [Prevotella sp.]MBR1594502.1 nucleosidase [Alloprevotella sp.]